MTSRIKDVVSSHNIRLIVSLLLIVLVTAGLYCSRGLKFNNDINVMLPQQKEILQTFEFFRESPLSKNIFLSLHVHQDQNMNDFLNYLDSFLKNLKTPYIRGVVKGLDPKNQLNDLQEYVRLSPQILTSMELEKIESQLSDNFISEGIQKNYHQLLSPTGFSASPFMDIDPFGFQISALKKLNKIMPFSDTDVEIIKGYVVNQAKHNVLVILETEVTATDGEKAKVLIRSLEDSLEALRPYAQVDLISTHLHALSNEIIIKKDILLTVMVASTGFLLLFFFLFKDLKSLLLFAIPMIAISLAIPICSWILGELSLIILGMAAVISGIAVDYCIHVYCAMKSIHDDKNALRHIAKPIFVGALTTIGVFSVFLLSEVPGYRQLALLTILSILISLFLAIYFLPLFLNKIPQPKYDKNKIQWVSFGKLDLPIIFIWTALMILFLLTMPFISFKTDVKQYDGSEAAIFKAEEQFAQDWGTEKQPAMLVVEATSEKNAIEKNFKILENLNHDDSFQSLSSVLPPERVRLENAARWNGFWKNGHQEQMERAISEALVKYDFNKKAFDPFLETLYRAPEDIKAYGQLEIIELLKKRFLFESKNKTKVINYFEDDQKKVDWVKQKVAADSSVFVVSTKAFRTVLSSEVLSEAKFLSLLIAFIIPVLTFLFLKNFKLTLIALLPVFTSVLAIFGALTLFGFHFNAANIIALLVVGGLSIDYGIFMIYQSERKINNNTTTAVTLSALTTLFGAGALVLAKHPVLFSYGATMLVGILAGYLSAVFVVPAFCRMNGSEKIFRATV